MEPIPKSSRLILTIEQWVDSSHQLISITLNNYILQHIANHQPEHIISYYHSCYCFLLHRQHPSPQSFDFGHRFGPRSDIPACLWYPAAMLHCLISHTLLEAETHIHLINSLSSLLAALKFWTCNLSCIPGSTRTNQSFTNTAQLLSLSFRSQWAFWHMSPLPIFFPSSSSVPWWFFHGTSWEGGRPWCAHTLWWRNC